MESRAFSGAAPRHTARTGLAERGESGWGPGKPTGHQADGGDHEGGVSADPADVGPQRTVAGTENEARLS